MKMKNIVTANKELNRWCGTEGIIYYGGDTALGFLFKSAVPKLLPGHDFAIYWVLDVDAPKGTWAISMSCPGYGENGIIRLRDNDPALALFWAIMKIIEVENC